MKRERGLCNRCGTNQRRSGRGAHLCEECFALDLCSKCGINPRVRENSRNPWCHSCQAEQQRSYRSRCVESGICVDCGVTPARHSRRTCAACEAKKVPYRKERADAYKRKVVDYKGAACLDCGLVSEYLDVYDFHHRVPSDKSFGIGTPGTSQKPWEDIVAELAKCDLLCANCHRVRHAKEGGRSFRKKAPYDLRQSIAA